MTCISMCWYEEQQQKVIDQMNQDLFDSVWNAKPLNIWESICNSPSLFEVMNFDKIIIDNLNNERRIHETMDN